MEVQNLAHVFAYNVIQEVENVGSYGRTNEIVSIMCTDIHGDLFQNGTFHDAEREKMKHVNFGN